MKEKLYTIPVNEAFDEECECPLCIMKKSLENNAIEFTMGPSYMEDDVREVTSRLGFCEKHIQLLYENQNRLGLALIMKTHMDKIIQEVEKHVGDGTKKLGGTFFKKKSDNPGVVTYLDRVEETCYICEKIEGTFQRYIATVFHLYHTDESFKNKFRSCKGFCTNHYKALYQQVPKYLSGEEMNAFYLELNQRYLTNMKRVRDDLEWFINKFDYRYAEEPWKNSKDALPRSIQKVNSVVK